MLIPKTRKEIYQAYLSGDTHLELPKPVTRDEIILYNACINGAGTNPSWNDLTDKPFGSEKAFEDIVWDGNTAGLVVVDDTFYKVSDSVLDDSAIKIGTITIRTSNGDMEMSASELWADDFSGADCVSLDAIVFVRKVNASDGYVVFPETGVYFSKTSKNTTIKFSAPETIKPLDSKYIVLTSPNGKKFNLSVSDSGTLSATAAT